MDKIRCYYKDSDGLHRVDVGDTESYEEAIQEVKNLFWQNGSGVKITVLAVVN